MAEPFGTKWAGTAQAIAAGQVDHLPIVAHCARRLGLVQIVNRLVPNKPKRRVRPLVRDRRGIRNRFASRRAP